MCNANLLKPALNYLRPGFNRHLFVTSPQLPLEYFIAV